jgi:tetratricopeptide (TPR) repeat protein
VGRFSVAALLLCAWTATAVGKPQQTPLERARIHYTTGLKAFGLSHFDAAAIEFEAAYDAQPDPALLYNIAQSNRLAGHLEKALSYYRNYLRLLPDTSDRAEVEKTMVAIEHQLNPTVTVQPAERAALTEPPPIVPPATPRPVAPPPEKKSSPAVGAGIGLLAAGIVVGLGGGIGLGFAAAKKASAIEDEAKSGVPFDPQLDDSRRLFQELGWACYAVGGALALTGIILLGVGMRGSDEPKSALRIAPVLGPNAVGASLAGAF